MGTSQPLSAATGPDKQITEAQNSNGCRFIRGRRHAESQLCAQRQRDDAHCDATHPGHGFDPEAPPFGSGFSRIKCTTP